MSIGFSVSSAASSVGDDSDEFGRMESSISLSVSTADGGARRYFAILKTAVDIRSIT